MQYACREYRERLAAAGLTASMSRRGSPYDNAAMESFNATYKREAVGLAPAAGGYATRAAATSDFLTPFGGLVPWAAFQKQCGILEALAATCPVARISPNAAPVYDVLTSLGLTLLCDGRRFVHVQRLREDPTLNELFGLQRVVCDDTLRRFVASVPEAAGAAWVAQATQRLWGALPKQLILD